MEPEPEPEPQLFLKGTGTVMNSDSGIGFPPESNIKCNTKVKKEKLQDNFLGNNIASRIEKERFCTNFLMFEKLCLISLDPELEPKPEPEPGSEPEPKLFQSRIRNQNRSKSLRVPQLCLEDHARSNKNSPLGMNCSIWRCLQQ